MVCIKGICELYPIRGEFLSKLIEDVDHLRNLVVIVLGMQFYGKVLRVLTAIAYHLKELNEVVHLIWITYERIDDSDLPCRADIIPE